MELRRDGWYSADKGKFFVLTEKGKNECASFRDKTVGEPVSEYDTEAVAWSIEKGYEIEVDIPNWIVKEGYEVVYDYKKCTLFAGNPTVFPELEIAEKYLETYKSYPWVDNELYIRTGVYEGRALRDCKEYNSKKVYNKDWYYGPDALRVGDLVEQEVIDDVINCLPPACMRSDCVQLGEPTSQRIGEDGKYHATYTTFKQINDDIWEYCGDCFRGENVQKGKQVYFLAS